VPPSGRRVPLVIWVAAGVLALLVVAAAVILLVTSRQPSEHKAKGALQLRRVLATTDGACPSNWSDRVPSVKSDVCYQLGGGMTITRVKSVLLKPPGGTNGSGFSVEIGLGPEDTARLGTLTTQVSAEQPPRNQLAIVADGRVASAPQVMEPITGGTIEITGTFTRAEAQRYVDLFD
jgi:hypothetical protein